MTGRGDHRPLLVLMSGVPGSGKLTLARHLADQGALRWPPILYPPSCNCRGGRVCVTGY